MKKILYFYIKFLLILGSTSTGALAQEILTKEKIYTLNSNEVVAHEENSLGLYQDKTSYIVVTADVKQFSRSYHIKNQTFGPYDRRLVEKPVFNISSWGFIDSKEETSDVVFNGQKIGVHKDPLYPVGLKVAGNSWSYVLIDQLEGTTKVVINGQEFGPFNFLKDYHISDDGSRWAIIYNDEPDKFYILFNNGKQIGPYKDVVNFRFLAGKGNRWVLTAELPGTLPKTIGNENVKLFSVITNTGEVGTFEEKLVGNSEYNFLNLLNKGENYGQAVVQNQKIYFLGNDELYGPYQQPPISIDMGEEYNKFNYIDPTTRTLHFKGDGIFAKNVRDYFVSASRKSVAVIKNAGSGKDSLYINDKYFKGIYNKIEYLKFAPGSEEWALLSNNSDGTYTLHFSDNRSFGPYPINQTQGLPDVLLGKDAKNWAFFYQDAKSGENQLLVNDKIRKEEFIGQVALVKEDTQEYFSWFSLDDRTVYLNKLLLE
ncbi:MAG: hypothetical protein NW226_19950 [Microscillaceae bacterium]|nr:hypothetical protein [Microscillaceae bacterium]